jgi:hypothetical protein
LRVTCVVCEVVRFDFDFFVGLATAGDDTNVPAAKQFTKIKALLFMLLLLL